MKVTMLETAWGSPTGSCTYEYLKGETYSERTKPAMSEALAKQFLKDEVATTEEPVQPEEESEQESEETPESVETEQESEAAQAEVEVAADVSTNAPLELTEAEQEDLATRLDDAHKGGGWYLVDGTDGNLRKDEATVALTEQLLNERS